MRQSTEFKNYIQKATKEFTMQHAQTFYLDVIHRGYTLKQYLDEGNLFNNEVFNISEYDFIKLRAILNISAQDAITHGNKIIADKIAQPFRLSIEAEFIQLLQDKQQELEQELREADNNELTEREKDTYRKYLKHITHALTTYEPSVNVNHDIKDI